MKNRLLVYLLGKIGGWPVLSRDWKGQGWSIEKSLSDLHDYIGVREVENVLRKRAPDAFSEDLYNSEQIKGSARSKRAADDDSFFTEYLDYMFKTAIALGADDSIDTRHELGEALELGIALSHLLSGSKFNRTSGVEQDEKIALKSELDWLAWLEIFHGFKLRNYETQLLNKRFSVYDNLKKLKMEFPKRAFANYILWRIVDFSQQFLDDEAQDNVIKFYQKSYGVLDKEQRWKLCTRMTNTYATLASGSLYVKDFFPEASRIAALEMVDNIKEEFQLAIKSSSWMDEKTKTGALDTLGSLTTYMGYDERLLDISEVEKYYGKPEKDFSHSFYCTGVQLNVHRADKAFKHKYRNESDWTVYSKPTTTQASYNRKDNTICMISSRCRMKSLLN